MTPARYCPDCPEGLRNVLTGYRRQRCAVCQHARSRKYHKDRATNLSEEQRAKRRASKLAYYHRNRLWINAAKRVETVRRNAREAQL